MISRRGALRRVAHGFLVWACVSAGATGARELTITIDKLETPRASAQALRAAFSGDALDALTLEAGAVTATGRSIKKTRATCAKLELTTQRWACANTVVEAGEKVPLSFAYRPSSRELSIDASPGGDESWRLTGKLDATPAFDLTLARAKLVRFTPFLPKDAPKITSGLVNGNVALQGDTVKTRLEVTALAFADASGLHAGEKIGATLEGAATEKAGEWRWNARFAWRAGEVFWQPVFVTAKGHTVDAEGVTTETATRVRNGRIDLPGIANVTFSAHWDHAKGALAELDARAARVRVGALYADLMKPLFEGTALSDMRAEGELALALKMSAAGIQSIDAEVSGISFEDRQRRFAVFGLSGRIPWRRDEATAGEIAIKGAEFMKVPVGAVRAPLRLRNTRVDVKGAQIPVMDGVLQLTDFVAGLASDGWRWRFSGDLSAVTMETLTQTLGLPTMHGILAASIPEVRYRRGTISMEGMLGLRVFDGAVRVEKLELIDPFGRAPRLHAEIDLHKIDLELLTRAFDFGTMTGRADAYVHGLELVAWEPVRFDARIESSEGSYPRKISQRAVQNISALGGAGAAAAIQRSLLRFFDEFGYEKLGLSCTLRNAVCEMDGIERAPQGYVIVKGGGIPAISVIGYNRTVNWRELVARLKRITQENVKPIVK